MLNISKSAVLFYYQQLMIFVCIFNLTVLSPPFWCFCYQCSWFGEKLSDVYVIHKAIGVIVPILC